MKTLRTMGLILGLSLSVLVPAQWLTGGNGVIATDYLGADATSVAPLHLRTIPDLRIDFSTSNKLRMNLNPDMTSLIGSFTVPTDGFWEWG
jgi:hypothetical protein